MKGVRMSMVSSLPGTYLTTGIENTRTDSEAMLPVTKCHNLCVDDGGGRQSPETSNCMGAAGFCWPSGPSKGIVLVVGVGLGKGPKSPVSLADSVAVKPLLMMKRYTVSQLLNDRRACGHLVTEVSVRKRTRTEAVEEARAKDASGVLQKGVRVAVWGGDQGCSAAPVDAALAHDLEGKVADEGAGAVGGVDGTNGGAGGVAAVVNFNEIPVEFGLKHAEGEGGVEHGRRRLREIEDEGAGHVVHVRPDGHRHAAAVHFGRGVGGGVSAGHFAAPHYALRGNAVREREGSNSQANLSERSHLLDCGKPWPAFDAADRILNCAARPEGKVC